MVDSVSGAGGGSAASSGAGSAADAAKEAEFEEKVVEALGLLLIGDVLSDQLKSEAEQRELQAENETAG